MLSSNQLHPLLEETGTAAQLAASDSPVSDMFVSVLHVFLKSGSFSPSVYTEGHLQDKTVNL